MKMIAAGDAFDEVVIGHPFDIPGCSEKFAVHASIGIDDDRGMWAASHVETGFAIAFGDTIEDAIEACCAKWNSKTPTEQAAALEKARQIRAERDAGKAGALQ